MQYLIKAVKIPLPSLLHDHPTLLQQIIVDVTANWISFEVKVNVHILSEPRRIVISVRFSITESFQNSI